MKFQEAVKLMEQGKICVINGIFEKIKYRIVGARLEYSSRGFWRTSHTLLSTLIKSEWELVEEKKKKTLSDKVKAAQFIDEDEIAIPYMAVKEHLKVLIKAINAGHLPSTLLKIVDEEFGDDLI